MKVAKNAAGRYTEENRKGATLLIYLDYAASAPPYPQAAQRQLQVMTECFANPGAIHSAGNRARQLLHQSRAVIARLLNVREQEVFFTSGGTEANNWAVKYGCTPGRRHIVAAATEHSSVLEPLKQMEARGCRVTYVRPDEKGRMDPEAVGAAMTADTGLLCVQAVNNETGVIQDVAAFAALAKQYGARYFCDAVQSFGHLRQELHKADLISLSAHKLGGPRGVGCLVVRYPHFIGPLMAGGGQERGFRSGTENLQGIAAFALAAELAMGEEETDLCRRLEEKLREAAPNMIVNGGDAPRHPGILNCRFPGITGEEMAVALDRTGICVSPGAACGAREGKPSHVLLAMGRSEGEAREALRFSLGRLTTAEEVDAAARAVADIVNRA